MTPLAWNILLLVLKWVFIGLIYLALFIVLIAVRKEMSLRVGGGSSVMLAPGRLQVLNPGTDPRLRPGDQLPLQPESNLGAAGGNDLVLGDQYISAYHARVRWDGVSWWAEDLGSTNGTYVDETRLTPHHPAQVPSGAILRLGDTAFRLLE